MDRLLYFIFFISFCMPSCISIYGKHVVFINGNNMYLCACHTGNNVVIMRYVGIRRNFRKRPSYIYIDWLTVLMKYAMICYCTTSNPTVLLCDSHYFVLQRQGVYFLCFLHNCCLLHVAVWNICSDTNCNEYKHTSFTVK